MVGGAVLLVAILTVAGQVGVALMMADGRNPTVAGMRLAVAALVVAGAIGVTCAAARSGLPWAQPVLADWLAWRMGHFGIGLALWVGGLIAAVSWQVLPMFYLTPAAPKAVQWGVLVAGVLSLLGIVAVLGTRAGDLMWLAMAPAAVAAWGVHPAVTLWALSKRRRKRADPSVSFWRMGMVCGLFTGVAAVLAAVLDAPSWSVLFAWLSIWGWAGAVVHGMLTRIVPFLVWFHRFSSLVGHADVPSMRALLPREVADRAYKLHLATTLVGAVACLTQWDLLARAAGLLLLATGLAMVMQAVLVARTTRAAERGLPVI